MSEQTRWDVGTDTAKSGAERVMDETHRIRVVEPEDLPVIAILEAEIFPGDPWSEELLRAAATHVDTLFLVAEKMRHDDGSGTAVYATQTGEEDETAACAEANGTDVRGLVGYCIVRTVLGEASVDNICVRDDFRRRGIARALLQEAMQMAKERYGAEAFTLEVRTSNTAARALYESMGFTLSGVRPGYYAHPREDACIYWKRELPSVKSPRY